MSLRALIESMFAAEPAITGPKPKGLLQAITAFFFGEEEVLNNRKVTAFPEGEAKDPANPNGDEEPTG